MIARIEGGIIRNWKIISALVLTLAMIGAFAVFGAEDSSADPINIGGGINYTLDETGGVYTASASWDKTTSEVTVEASVTHDEKTYVVKELKAFGKNAIVTKVTIKSNDQLTLAQGTLQKSSNLQIIELGEGITSLPKNFAASNTKLTTVNLSNVTTVGDAAFGGCTSLSSADLSKATSIGASAFDGCTSLSSADLSKATSIGATAFRGCTGLTSVDLSKATEIGKNAFLNCNALESVSLSPDLEIVGDTAFKSCIKLQSISLPGNILSVGTGMFQSCTGLSNVEFDPNFKTIGKSMFDGCTSLTVIDLKNVESVGINAFRNCTGLTSVVIPDSVKAIGNMAFESCTSLSSCNLGSSLESLGYQVFKDCPLITGKMVIPATLATISLHMTGIPTFPKNLSEIEVEEGNTVFASKDGILYDADLKTVLYCPGAKTGEVIISASVGAYAFTGCHLSRITILDGAVTIGNVAFEADYDDPTLEELILPDSLESIGPNIVAGQTNLKAIILPSELGSLGNIFSGLTGLEYVVFPSTAFVALSANTLNGATFYYSDNTIVPANAANDSINTLQGLRFVWDGTTAGNFYQITDDQVLLTMNVKGELSYRALSKESAVITESPVASEHMVFKGWFCDSEFKNLYDDTVVPTTDIVVYALFVLETHTVTYILDGEEIAVEVYEYGAEVPLLQTPVKIGYTVGAWASENVVPVDGSFTIGEFDIVFAAASVVNPYTITFDSAGGSAIDAIVSDYGATITAPAAPSREGYSFLKWDSIIPTTMPANDMTVKAIWAVVAVADKDGASTVVLDSNTDSFIPSVETKVITVKLSENTSVKVDNAEELAGKTVVSKVESVSNKSGITGAAYEFTFTADGETYNGKIQVTLPYIKEKGKDPAVYFWNGSESTKMTVVSSTDTSVTFETDHNSTYVVASESSSKGADGSEFMLAYGMMMAAGIIIAMLIGVIYYRKHA